MNPLRSQAILQPPPLLDRNSSQLANVCTNPTTLPPKVVLSSGLMEGDLVYTTKHGSDGHQDAGKPTCDEGVEYTNAQIHKDR